MRNYSPGGKDIRPLDGDLARTALSPLDRFTADFISGTQAALVGNRR